MSSLRDLTCQKFGRLTVIELLEKENGNVYWLCQCDCGNLCRVSRRNLKNGNTISCGCFRRDYKKVNAKYNYIKHKRLYEIWGKMKDRCLCKTAKDYCRYGGRGITVCQEWEKSFDNFLEWALTNGYRDDLTIDRIDNNGNYEPSNCRWATRQQQNMNKSSNKYITYNGEIKTITDWAKTLNMSAKTIGKRFRENKPVEDVLYNGNLQIKKLKEKKYGK